MRTARSTAARCGTGWERCERVDPDLTWAVGNDVTAALPLEFAASEPYTRFVFSSESQALAARQYLVERGLAEFSPPHLRLLRQAGRVVGMLAALTGAELVARRLRAALAMSRSGLLAGDDDATRRLRLAGQTLLKVRPDDYYISRIASAPTARGQGLGGFMLRQAEETARELGCPRLVLEVSPASAAAVRLYQGAGLIEVDARRVADEATGRALEYLHLVKLLGPS
jgi:ribosomal protein S18 acetylase RimI-like enzyme